MSLGDYFRIFRLHWRIILACLLAGGALGALLSFGTTPIYQSSATLFISTPDSSGVAGAYTGSLFTQQRVKSYVNFVSSPKVAASVINRLGLDTAPGALASQITASAPQDTSLINVSVTDPSPRRAQQLTQA